MLIQLTILWGTQLEVAAFVAALTAKITQTQEEHDMFRSKPNHCISSGRNMSCSHIIKSWGTQLGVAAFMAALTD